LELHYHLLHQLLLHLHHLEFLQLILDLLDFLVVDLQEVCYQLLYYLHLNNLVYLKDYQLDHLHHLNHLKHQVEQVYFENHLLRLQQKK
tara:strand:+ start:42 stop:308 length:267 start_codon:yes stop_codon:yes gene_type:complete